MSTCGHSMYKKRNPDPHAALPATKRIDFAMRPTPAANASPIFRLKTSPSPDGGGSVSSTIEERQKASFRIEHGGVESVGTVEDRATKRADELAEVQLFEFGCPQVGDVELDATRIIEVAEVFLFHRTFGRDHDVTHIGHSSAVRLRKRAEHDSLDGRFGSLEGGRNVDLDRLRSSRGRSVLRVLDVLRTAAGRLETKAKVLQGVFNDGLGIVAEFTALFLGHRLAEIIIYPIGDVAADIFDQLVRWELENRFRGG